MKTCFLLLALWCVTDVFSQSQKYLISFTDKQNNAHQINNPATFLSPKAIHRRTLFNIPIDSTDLPVSAFYINQIKSVPFVKVLSASKWLNQVLIETNNSNAITQIQLLPFVKKSDLAGRAQDKTLRRIRKTLTHSGGLKKSNNDTNLLKYGVTYDQVHLHEGEYLHNKGFTGKGVSIAVLDAGFYAYNNIDVFDSMIINARMKGEVDLVDFDGSTSEDDAHGMLCLGILASNKPGTMVGTAPHADYWLIRTENVGIEMPVEEHNWVAGAEFADSVGADLISSSLGYNEFDNPAYNHTKEQLYKNATMISYGAALAAKKGIIVMNSAGNEGLSNWKYIIFPADADSVCAVGAVNINKTIAPFSSKGYPGKIKPNIVSLGVNTAVPGLSGPASANGTSLSNPNIGGLIACVKQAFPNFSNMEILNAVYKSSDQYSNPDSLKGYGIPNMRKTYGILKKAENEKVYGSEFFWVNPFVFSDSLHIRIIPQNDGPFRLQLLNEQYQVIDSMALIGEYQEMIETSFKNLQMLFPGKYFVRYLYANSGITKEVMKTGPSNIDDWLLLIRPGNGNNYLKYLAKHNGKSTFKLIDARGSILEVIELKVSEQNAYQINFKKMALIPKGAYFIEFSGHTRKVLKFIK